MVFTDPIFIFAFLPISLALYYLSLRFFGGNPAIWVLLIASGVFYGYWSVKYLALMLFQILVNYIFARRLGRSHSMPLLWAGVAFNLLLLGYFKYRNFFLENLELKPAAKSNSSLWPGSVGSQYLSENSGPDSSRAE